MEEAAGTGGFSQVPNLRSLLKLRRDVVELRVQGRADRVHGRNDHDRNASSDETILNRGGARLVLQERNNLRHETSTWLKLAIICTDDGSTVPPPVKKKLRRHRRNCFNSYTSRRGFFDTRAAKAKPSSSWAIFSSKSVSIHAAIGWRTSHGCREVSPVLTSHYPHRKRVLKFIDADSPTNCPQHDRYRSSPPWQAARAFCTCRGSACRPRAACACHPRRPCAFVLSGQSRWQVSSELQRRRRHPPPQHRPVPRSRPRRQPER